jgi:hypothetical protein
MLNRALLTLSFLTILSVGFASNLSNDGLLQDEKQQKVNQRDKEGRKQGHWIYFGKDRPEEGYPANG